MELQFGRQVLPCMRLRACEVRNEEQTQEVRLSDAMPDVGKVLGAWGQVLLRSKDWRGGSTGISGGIMVWVLYAPEDGSEPRPIETWIPFQMRWELPDSEQDGTLHVACLLRSVDARTLSARKLMVRCVVSVQAQALEPGKQEIAVPENIPQDVQLLRRKYPVCIPAEAGEKAFALDEELTLPQSAVPIEKLISNNLRPELIDQKIMGDKVVFRGAAIVHILYRGDDGRVYGWDFEIPFSQYADLERDYGPDAMVRVTPVMTSLELEQDAQGRLRLKAGLAGQYVVYDKPTIELVEDAYSNVRSVQPQTEYLQMPVLLDMVHETVHAEQSAEADLAGVADTAFYMGHPSLRCGADSVSMELPGSWQLLGYDEGGRLQSTTARWDGSREMPADADGKACAWASASGAPQVTFSQDGVTLRSDIVLDVLTYAGQGMPMVTGLELGEMSQPDPARPSLVLRRMENDSLWELAKRSGSTVDAILSANGLQSEPEPGRMLLIPIA